VNSAARAAATFNVHLLVQRAVGRDAHNGADHGGWWPRPAGWAATGTICRLHLLLHRTREHRAWERRAFAGRAAAASGSAGGQLGLLGAVQSGAFEQTHRLHTGGFHCAHHTLAVDRAKARAAIFRAGSSTLATISRAVWLRNVHRALSTNLADSCSSSSHNTFVTTVAGGMASGASASVGSALLLIQGACNHGTGIFGAVARGASGTAIRSVHHFLLFHRAGDRGTVERRTRFANRASIATVAVRLRNRHFSLGADWRETSVHGAGNSRLDARSQGCFISRC